MLASSLPWEKSSFRLASVQVGNVAFLTCSILLLLLTQMSEAAPHRRSSASTYNSTYPFTEPVTTSSGKVFRIALVTDLDRSSKSKEQENTWISYYTEGTLTLSPENAPTSVDIELAEPEVLSSHISDGERGMELSELIVFNGKLYACDDKTGTMFEIRDKQPVPWVTLKDGDGTLDKGFKCEWATVKNELLYVGGPGKPWTEAETGRIVNRNKQWVKTITPEGHVEHMNWMDKYDALREAAGISDPGYIIHEAAAWSDLFNQWFFLPRRASHEMYDDQLDEEKATNLLFRADADFETIGLTRVGDINPKHGFSSFKFIPGTSNQLIVALKTKEYRDEIASYIVVFNIDGDIVMGEKNVGNVKYEGIEFI